MKVNSILNYSL